MKKKMLIAVIACFGLAVVSLVVIGDFPAVNQEVAAEEDNEEVEAEINQEVKEQIAYVDMYQLFEDHPWHDEAELEFEGEAERIKEELEVRGVDLTDEERQQLLHEYEDHLTNLEQELIEGIISNIDEKIESVAKEKGILLVVDHSAVAYGGHNLTDEVLTEIEDNIEDESEELKDSEQEIELEEDMDFELEE